MSPTEIRAMGNEEVRYWCDLIIQNREVYLANRGS